MKNRRAVWPLLLVFAVWQVLRPVMYGLLAATGVSPLVPWTIFMAGMLAIAAWFVRWLYLGSAPRRELLARGRREHPGAEVRLVGLDSEWNPIAESAVTLLIADGARFTIEGALDVPAGDVVSVDTTMVSLRGHALEIVVGDATWTAVVRGGRWGSAGDRAITHEAAARIRGALGLEVLDHVLD